MVHPQNRGREHQVVLTSHPTAGRCCAQRIGQNKQQTLGSTLHLPSTEHGASRVPPHKIKWSTIKNRKIRGRDGRESVAITRRHSAIEQSHVSRPKTLFFSKHIGPHCKASGHRASAATTTTSTARCQTARRFPSHPRSSTNQPIIATANTIVATTKPTEQRSPPSVTPSSSTEFSSPSATDAVPTKLRN